MCGIAGFVNLDGRTRPDDPDLQLMIHRLRHRGPDGFGYFHEPGIGFAHARLSIIDRAGGRQPLCNEDRQVWVTFNGEIFNYIELRRELEAAGHVFATRSDTEVLVHAYEEYGVELVHRLNGQFAFAIWDARRQRLLLARDRVGIAPLFYAERDGRLVFASEIKALEPAIGLPDRLSAEAIDQVFTFWSTLTPHTMFPGVFELSPGHLLIAERGNVRLTQYWDWTFPVDGGHSEEDAGALAEQLRELLIDATRLRLRSDVPVGAYLSGGLDSSVLTTIIGRHTETPLRTFSIGFDEPRLDETAFQRELIDHLQADHTLIQCGNGDVAANIAAAIRQTETVVLRTACVPMLLLSRAVHEEGYRVVLTGEGADEVLGGYDLFKEAKIRQFWARRPASHLRPALLRRLYPYLEASPGRATAYAEAFFRVGMENPQGPFFAHLPRWTTTAKCKEFFSDGLREELRDNALDRLEAALPAAQATWSAFNRAQYIESRSILSGYLLCSQGDRMLMANSVEGRFPFLDHRLIEFARRIPPRLLMKGLNEKYLLKRAMGAELPASIVRRDKQPYRAPGVRALLGADRSGELRALLSASAIREFGYFDPDRVDRLVQKIDAGRAIGEKDNIAIAGILSTQLLHREFIDHAAADSPVHSHQLPVHQG